ncbi:hypothetical protein AV530_009047 [Patagioenas fasciata monilis]|uniref:Uncharacterized protein n=1 Tax=Patagioenas fasciata monilis TaxID=372326 RepID=A0A1V4KQY2_PATFA|nr:hypothetical protein AV530_009047 [Patagioenas fasciata monilis]
MVLTSGRSSSPSSGDLCRGDVSSGCFSHLQPLQIYLSAMSCSVELMGWQKHQEHLLVHMSSTPVINASPGKKTLQEQKMSRPALHDLHKPNQTGDQTLGITAEKFAPLLGIYKPTLPCAFYRKSKQ